MKTLALLSIFLALPLWAGTKATTCSTTMGGPACSGGDGGLCVNLSWTASSTQGVTYSIYRGTTSGGESLTPIAQGITGTTWQDNNLPLSAPDLYYYAVAFLGSLSSIASNETCAAVPTVIAPATNVAAVGQHN